MIVGDSLCLFPLQGEDARCPYGADPATGRCGHHPLTMPLPSWAVGKFAEARPPLRLAEEPVALVDAAPAVAEPRPAPRPRTPSAPPVGARGRDRHDERRGRQDGATEKILATHDPARGERVNRRGDAPLDRKGLAEWRRHLARLVPTSYEARIGRRVSATLRVYEQEIADLRRQLREQGGGGRGPADARGQRRGRAG